MKKIFKIILLLFCVICLSLLIIYLLCNFYRNKSNFISPTFKLPNKPVIAAYALDTLGPKKITSPFSNDDPQSLEDNINIVEKSGLNMT